MIMYLIIESFRFDFGVYVGVVLLWLNHGRNISYIYILYIDKFSIS